MPYRRRKSSYRRKRRPRRRGRKVISRVRGVTGFPDAMYSTLKYVSHISVTQILNTQTYRGNSLFDPDFTSIGHQPLGFDEYALIYDRYFVYSSTINVIAVNNSTSVPAHIALMPGSSTTPVSTDPTVMKEQAYCKYKILPISRGTGIVSLFNRSSTKKMRGETVLDDSFGAITNNTPQRQWYWHLIAKAADLTSSAIDVSMTITMTFKCRFHKRRVLNQS